MRSSFYSTQNGFNMQKTGIVETLKVKNVLELTSDDREQLTKIRQFMQEQVDELTLEVAQI